MAKIYIWHCDRENTDMMFVTDTGDGNRLGGEDNDGKDWGLIIFPAAGTDFGSGDIDDRLFDCQNDSSHGYMTWYDGSSLIALLTSHGSDSVGPLTSSNTLFIRAADDGDTPSGGDFRYYESSTQVLEIDSIDGLQWSELSATSPDTAYVHVGGYAQWSGWGAWD